MRSLARSMLPALIAITAPADAQVIEINSNGEAVTYTAPTVFTSEGTSPAIAPLSSAQVSTTAQTIAFRSVEQQYGLAEGLLDAVIFRESRGRMSAVSPKGALGIMQLMPGTAAELGVDPRDRDQNIRGGAIYLKRQIDRFGTVALGLAAYNAGPNAVARYGGIPPYRETQAYVSAIMARWQSGKEMPVEMYADRLREPISNPLLIEVSAP